MTVRWFVNSGTHPAQGTRGTWESLGPTEETLLGALFDVTNPMKVGVVAPVGLASQRRSPSGNFQNGTGIADPAPHDLDSRTDFGDTASSPNRLRLMARRRALRGSASAAEKAVLSDSASAPRGASPATGFGREPARVNL
jgi:hypothetical protein